MFAPRFQIYLHINRWLQQILYMHSQRYKLNLSGFFDTISDIPYVAIKTDTPYMVDDFPDDYPVGRDIDLIVAEENFGVVVDRAESFALSNHGFKVVKLRERESFRLRFEFGGVLHYQIHVSFGIANLSPDFVQRSIAGRRQVRNFYVPDPSFEIVYRLIDYCEHPHKAHHLEYARRHQSSMNWALFDDFEIK